MFARIFSPLIQSLAFASATIFLGVAFVVQGQEAAPPGANALPPINVGEGGQVKEGGLSLGSLIVKGGSVFEGNVGINMASDIELAVRGKVGAEQFCDTKGKDCIDIDNLVSGNGLWSSRGNDKIYYNKGNVGIGTNNPLSTLDVDGRITATDLRLLGFLLFDDNTGGDYIAHTSQDGLSYYENGKEQWRLAGKGDSYINGGKVGIGTTEPVTRLSVEGDVSADRYCDKNGENCGDFGEGFIDTCTNGQSDGDGKGDKANCVAAADLDDNSWIFFKCKIDGPGSMITGTGHWHNGFKKWMYDNGDTPFFCKDSTILIMRYASFPMPSY
ncbi:MAG: hypothetical protein ACKKL4_02880 [Patescibacteria group bacterium]